MKSLLFERSPGSLQNARKPLRTWAAADLKLQGSGTLKWSYAAIHVRIFMCVFIRMYIYICTHPYIHIFIMLYIHIHIYIYVYLTYFSTWIDR